MASLTLKHEPGGCRGANQGIRTRHSGNSNLPTPSQLPHQPPKSILSDQLPRSLLHELIWLPEELWNCPAPSAIPSWVLWSHPPLALVNIRINLGSLPNCPRAAPLSHCLLLPPFPSVAHCLPTPVTSQAS